MRYCVVICVVVDFDTALFVFCDSLEDENEKDENECDIFYPFNQKHKH